MERASCSKTNWRLCGPGLTSTIAESRKSKPSLKLMAGASAFPIQAFGSHSKSLKVKSPQRIEFCSWEKEQHNRKCAHRRAEREERRQQFDHWASKNHADLGVRFPATSTAQRFNNSTSRECRCDPVLF